MVKEDIIKEFTSIKGVGKTKAELLINSGFDSIEKLKNATVQELVKVKGISENNANDILNQLKDDAKKEKGKVEVAKEKKDEELEIIEESTEEYKAKKKPEITKIQKEKLLIRKRIKKNPPKFFRQEWFRYKRLDKKWRKPNGITSKMRINLKYRPNRVRVGFRGPKEVRGLHASGFEEVMAFNVSDLENINPKKQAVRIGSTVGTKKRLEIAKRAEELEIRILNMKE